MKPVSVSDDPIASPVIIPSRDRRHALRTIGCAGIAVGVLDGTYAVVASALRGVSATRVFQYVASGAYGRASFRGGLSTTLAGVGFHFLTAFIVASAYYFAARKIAALRRHFVLCGFAYGAVVHLTMQFIVVPLSATPPLARTLSGFLTGLLAHLLFVGLPAAWVTSRMLR